MSKVKVNGIEVGIAPKGDWDEAMFAIVAYAVDHFPSEEWNNFAQRRSLALDAFAKSLGLDTFPMLTSENTREVGDTMEVML